MNRYKVPKPQQFRTHSLPKLKLVEESPKSYVYSKAALISIKKRSIPSHEFKLQVEPKKTFKINTKSILSSPNVVRKGFEKSMQANGYPEVPDAYYYYCNILINKKRIPSLYAQEEYLSPVPRLSDRLSPLENLSYIKKS